MADGNQEREPRNVKIQFPAAFVNPYEHTDRSGRTWQKAIVNIPSGTRVNGVDLTGYSLDTFLRDFHMQDKVLGKPVTFSFPENENIALFRGSGDGKRTLEVKPWDLTKAVKAEREAYQAQRAKEREDVGIDLDAEGHDARDASGAMGTPAEEVSRSEMEK